MKKLTWKRAAAWRIHRHHLVERAPAGSLLEVASRICGLHAQVLSSAELTAWARMDGLDREAVPRALWEERTLVKTWAMRGTLHLLPSRELPLWHAALGVSPRYLKPALWKRAFGITMAELERLTDAIAQVLEGQVLTREQLVANVVKVVASARLAKIAGSSWGTILKPAAFQGRLCFGPSVGQRVQFTSPRTWLAAAGHAHGAPMEVPAAQAEITRRFLAAYAPATAPDLARWWGSGGATGAKKWIAALGDEVAPVDLEGVQAWMLAADVREAAELPPPRSVSLLPGFDHYVVAASRHAAHLLPGELRGRVFRPQGWISPVLLVNGMMLGVWRHQMKGSRVEVAIYPFVAIPSWVRRGAAQEAERLAAFLGAKLELTWKS